MADEVLAEVELFGHKANVSGIKGRLSDNLWHKEDTLDVWISFDEPVEGIPPSFAIELPAKPYSRTEFLDLVVRKGETRLREFSVKHAKERTEMKAREDRQKALDHLARMVEAEVGEEMPPPEPVQEKTPDDVTEDDVPDLEAVFRICFHSWQMPPEEVCKQLGYKTTMEAYASGRNPWHAWLTIKGYKEQ